MWRSVPGQDRTKADHHGHRLKIHSSSSPLIRVLNTAAAEDPGDDPPDTP
jgi:hypothetical protein